MSLVQAESLSNSSIASRLLFGFVKYHKLFIFLGAALYFGLTFAFTSIASANSSYTVQPGDTLGIIAARENTTVEALVAANNIQNANFIRVGQVLTIPTASSTADVASAGAGVTNSILISSAPETPPTTETDPTVQGNVACTRFNFEKGRDAQVGATAGQFLMVDPSHGPIASWTATAGQTDSGWINNLPTQFNSIYVEVYYYENSGAIPIKMEIVNPASETTQGWLTQGLCHAMEIQYPAGYRR